MRVKFSLKLASQPSDDSSNHYNSISRNSFLLMGMRGWKLEKLANGKDISGPYIAGGGRGSGGGGGGGSCPRQENLFFSNIVFD